MRGADRQTGAMFSYLSREAMVPAGHPLRLIRPIVNAALERLWLDELREQIVTGVGDAEEQVSYVDASDPGVVKQASLTLAALVASRDAIVRAASRI